MKNDENKFPLLFWQETPEYQTLFEAECSRLKRVWTTWRNTGGEWSVISSEQFDKDGEFQFWLNTRSVMKTASDVGTAIVRSKKYGIFGWWCIEDLENLLRCEGKLFQSAMWENGFRRHATLTNRWVRRTKNERRTLSKDPPTQVFAIESEEGRRLAGLITIPNAKPAFDSTLSFLVGKKGMIYGYLNVNPFGGSTMESMAHWAAGYKVRGHINKQQDGFVIEAKNIILGQEAYIHIITHGDCPVSECLWPTVVQRGNETNIAEFLVTGEPYALVC